MKKRLAVLLCAIMLVFTMLPLTVSAAKGNIEGVDYDRIMDVTNGHQVTLTLGNMDFIGHLTNGIELSEEEQDRIIKQAMNDMKITSGMLLNAENLIKAAQNVKGFGMDDVIRAAMKLSGASDLLAIYSYFMGTTKDPAVVAKDIATAQLNDAVMNSLENTFQDAVTDGGTIALKGLGKFSAKLLFMLPDLGEIGLDALAKYENNKYIVATGTERLVLLEAFYKECNNRIKDATGEGGEWRIVFNGATSTNQFNFWGIGGLMSEWTLTGELVRQVTGADEQYGGTYQGTLYLEISGVDMKNSFDSQFKNKEVFLNGGGDYPQGEKVLWENQGVTTIKDEYQTTVIKRIVSGDLMVYITEGSGELHPTVLGSLTSNSDNIEFSFNHKIVGTGTFTSPYATVTMENTIQYSSNDITYYTYQSSSKANGVVLDADTQSGRVEPNIGTIWDPLESSLTMIINTN